MVWYSLIMVTNPSSQIMLFFSMPSKPYSMQVFKLGAKCAEQELMGECRNQADQVFCDFVSKKN